MKKWLKERQGEYTRYGENKVMSILNYPEKTCSICKGNTWWYTSLNPEFQGEPTWKCGTCYPPSSEAITLKMRIIKGNYLLHKARIAILKMQPGEVCDAAKQNWFQAIVRIGELGRQLRLFDTGCLYIEGKNKLKKCMDSPECYACSNDYWPMVELLDLDKKLHPEVWA